MFMWLGTFKRQSLGPKVVGVCSKHSVTQCSWFPFLRCSVGAQRITYFWHLVFSWSLDSKFSRQRNHEANLRTVKEETDSSVRVRARRKTSLYMFVSAQLIFQPLHNVFSYFIFCLPFHITDDSHHTSQKSKSLAKIIFCWRKSFHPVLVLRIMPHKLISF